MAAETDSTSGRTCRLLAIDDNRDSADLVVRVAQKCGYEAKPFLGREDLRAALKTCPPDVLSLDLCMPNEDGIRMMSILEESGFKGRIVIISGQEEWFRKSAARLATARGLKIAGDMAKPIDIAELMKLLNSLRDLAGSEAAPRQASLA
jgi:DNA-binding NtrC family response regulator